MEFKFKVAFRLEAGFPSHGLSYEGLIELKSVRAKARNTAWVQGRKRGTGSASFGNISGIRSRH